MKVASIALAAAVAAFGLKADPVHRIVMVGDSITAQSVGAEGFSTRMAQQLPGETIVALGWSGQVLSGWKNAEESARGGTGNYGTNLETGYYVGTELDKPADAIFVMLGMNDALKPTTYRTADSLAVWKANLKAFAQNLKAREAGKNATIYLASVTLLTEDLEGPKNLLLDDLATAAKDVVNELGAGFAYVPVRENMKMFLEMGRMAHPEFHICADFVHPMGGGHAVIAASYLTALGKTAESAKMTAAASEVIEAARANAPAVYVPPKPDPWLVSDKTFSLQYACTYPDLDDAKASGAIEAAIEGGAKPDELLAVDTTRLSGWTTLASSVNCFGGASSASICYNQLFNAGPFSAAYAARYVYSPSSRVVTLKVTSENFSGCPSVAVWLNGEKVHVGRETTKSVQLKKGNNLLYVRSFMPEWVWQQSVAFAPSDSCADVSDLQYGVAPFDVIDASEETKLDDGIVTVNGAAKIVCLDEEKADYAITYLDNGGTIAFSEDVRVDVLVVAGGGGGGFHGGGGGGAGGMIYRQRLDVKAGSYDITIGLGGLGATSASEFGGNGGDSSVFGLVAKGGGGGGSYQVRNGQAGGSGGGAAGHPGASGVTPGIAGAGTDGQGFAGGTGYTTTDWWWKSGGGGGAGEEGVTASDADQGKGGTGKACWITGESVYYAGGGGGGRTDNGGTTVGGAGGGAAGHGYGWDGTDNVPQAGEDAVDGLGGGGGGGGGFYHHKGAVGGNGGSGVVIVRYSHKTDEEPVGDVTAEGATVTTDNEETIFTFSGSGQMTLAKDCKADILLVGGGGGGGGHGGGGGGAGGVKYVMDVTIPAGTYPITVGLGGAGSENGYAAGANGQASSAFGYEVSGGGGGGSVYTRNGQNGGSGGGACGTIGWQVANNNWPLGVKGLGQDGFGHAGGEGWTGGEGDWSHASGGGGGASTPGGGATSNKGGVGGDGIRCAITGTGVYYGGGGSGGMTSGYAKLEGGLGGGGFGSGYSGDHLPDAGGDGTDGLGGGGGGGGGYYHHDLGKGGKGGKGTVIVRILKATESSDPITGSAPGLVQSKIGHDLIFVFPADGKVTVNKKAKADILIVAGGGGGGCHSGGGGGAGGVVYLKDVEVVPGVYEVTVGAGGNGSDDRNKAGESGGNSGVFGYEALGGGGGGSYYVRNGLAGGSGGGAAGISSLHGWPTGVAGAGTSGQGSAGGLGFDSSDWWGRGGGGGGASLPGGNADNGTNGTGGDGIACDITGSSIVYGGGGGGGFCNGAGSSAGGNGGGGAGHGYDWRSDVPETDYPTPGENGVDGLGGGGGGGGGYFHHHPANGGNGGSGVVIIRYKLPPLGFRVIVK